MTISRLGQLIRFASTSFGHLDPGRGRERLAQRFEKALLRPGHPLGLGVERGALQAGQDRLDRLGVEHPAGRRRRRGRRRPPRPRWRPRRPGRGRCASAGADDEARRKSRSSGPSAVTSTVSGLSAPCEIPALRRTSTAAEEAVDLVIADVVSRQLGEPVALGQAGDERGVVGRTAPPGRHDLGDPRAGVSGQEGQVGLVLHLLEPVEDERRPRVAVDAEAPYLAQPLRVGGVAPVDGQFERCRPSASVPANDATPHSWCGRGAQPVHLDLQVAHGVGHLRGGRKPVRRAQGQVAGGRGAPADDDARP